MHVYVTCQYVLTSVENKLASLQKKPGEVSITIFK